MSERAVRRVVIGVVCAAVAVGGGIAYAAATRFVRVPISAPARATLSAVSCSSASSCFAVGEYSRRIGTSSLMLTLRWNGESWKQISAPTPPGASALAVSCASSRGCMIVGVKSTSSGNGPYAERWGGHKWHVLRAASLPGNDNILNGVSCPSVSDCVAVGATQVQTSSQAALVERWDGHGWTAERVPGASKGFLRSVSCAMPGDCWAVGLRAITANTQSPLIVHIGKSGARVVNSPVGSGILASVSCPTASACWAVGNGREPLLVGLQNGSWREFAAADRSGQILGISCVTATECWAVGMGFVAGTQQPVPGQTFKPGGQTGPWAATWNGSSWTDIQTPAVSGTFSAVDCPDSTVCFAAGYTGHGLGHALVARSQSG